METNKNMLDIAKNVACGFLTTIVSFSLLLKFFFIYSEGTISYFLPIGIAAGLNYVLFIQIEKYQMRKMTEAQKKNYHHAATVDVDSRIAGMVLAILFCLTMVIIKNAGII